MENVKVDIFKVDISDLEDGIYFLCPKCLRPSKFVEASGYGYVSFHAKLELSLSGAVQKTR